jgi:osmotically-inducible protein OsmY
MLTRRLPPHSSLRGFATFFGIFALLASSPFLSAHAVDSSQPPELTDLSISEKVNEELAADPGVIATRISVTTTDGVVTLTGTVNNILAKERAVRVAETVKGVRAVVNRVNVRPSHARTDDEIKRDVDAALLQDPATDRYQIIASVQDGKVFLKGTVDSYQERALANLVVKGVRGVTAVDDQITVDYQTQRLDSEIQHEIERTLRWNTLVDDALISVHVDDGAVTLSGTVGSAAEKRLARADAWVAGVQSVDAKDLSVEKWARDDALRADKHVKKSDSELQNAVKDALLHDPRVMSFNVDVDVVGSTVTLRGIVGNLQAKRAAEQDARNTVGVWYVANRLKVVDESPPSDSQIADDIRVALLRDPYVERFDVTATVLDGTAYLYGSVDSTFERSRAEDIVSRVAGVLDVRNRLAVADTGIHLYDPYVDDTYVDRDMLAGYEERAPLKTDTEIRDAIESEIWWSPFVESDEVTVEVDDGIATLTGTVDTWSERQSATENAYEGGATLVDNDLRVSYD